MSEFYLERIRRGVDFIEAHLDDDVALAAVARAAGLSQWHFQRIFRSITGETLKAYIRARRMAFALDRLLTTELRVVDIAVHAGFESQEAFARAFKQAFGISPVAYRKLGKRNLFPKKLELDDDALRHLHGGVSLEPTLADAPAMTLVGLRTRFFGVDSDKNNLGEKLPGLWAAFLSRLHEVDGARPGVCYGVIRQQADDTDELEYFAAIAVDGIESLPAGMEAVHVPAATYARFEHHGPAPAVDHTVSYAYSTWLMRSPWRHTGGPDLEIYDGRYHPTDAASVFEYALPIVAAPA
ncbi:MAG: AraC family transcriptional regulator [Myxococcales bacterium]|nr:AraC family transcriptional regulator [Myxococcales bacterium]